MPVWSGGRDEDAAGDQLMEVRAEAARDGAAADEEAELHVGGDRVGGEKAAGEERGCVVATVALACNWAVPLGSRGRCSAGSTRGVDLRTAAGPLGHGGGTATLHAYTHFSVAYQRAAVHGSDQSVRGYSMGTIMMRKAAIRTSKTAQNSAYHRGTTLSARW
ncbi:MAG: hypothetical protein ACRD0K_01430 [Egibacteraceae bacterium]